MPRNLIKQQGGRPIWAVPPATGKWMRHSPGNPWFGAVHDGVSESYNAGFAHKAMNHVYRFKWNSQPIGSGPFYLRNPGGKCPHWLEISGLQKFKVHALGAEAMMHTQLACVVTAIVIWNLTRYLFFHPDLTLYNVAYFTLRKYMDMLRNNRPTNLDSPVFRWAQQPPEFYNYHPQREFIEMGVLANDPQVEYMKAIGKADLLTKYHGEKGFNTAVDYLPHHKWGWSYKEKGPENPIPSKDGGDHGNGHGHH